MLKPLFWNKIPPHKLDSTLWKEIPVTITIEIPINYTEIETLFPKNTPSSTLKLPTSPTHFIFFTCTLYVTSSYFLKPIRSFWRRGIS